MMDIRSGACESKQNGRLVRQYGCHSNSVSSRRGCFTKKLILNQAIAALRRFIGLPGQFVTVWKNQTHTHTHTTTVPLRRLRIEG